MRVKFINHVGGIMLVDESRVNEYKEAGYMPASDVIDVEAKVVDENVEPTPKKKATRRKKED